MKDTLRAGLEHRFSFRVPENKTVPALYPESAEFQAMPRVFATGYLVGFIEWACIDLLKPHLDWPAEQTVGTHVNVSHSAATPPGMAVEARVRLSAVDGRRLVFEVEAFDAVDVIARGTHERFIIQRERFDQRLAEKSARGTGPA